MKNKILVLLFALAVILSSGLLNADKASAKICHFNIFKHICCLHQKNECCKQCNRKNCCSKCNDCCSKCDNCKQCSCKDFCKCKDCEQCSDNDKSSNNDNTIKPDCCKK